MSLMLLAATGLFGNPIVLALIQILIVVLVALVVAWLVDSLLPGEAPYKQLARGLIGLIALVIILVILYGLLR